MTLSAKLRGKAKSVIKNYTSAPRVKISADQRRKYYRIIIEGFQLVKLSLHYVSFPFETFTNKPHPKFVVYLRFGYISLMNTLGVHLLLTIMTPLFAEYLTSEDIVMQLMRTLMDQRRDVQPFYCYYTLSTWSRLAWEISFSVQCSVHHRL